jgi:NADP-dependent 3-hydroxy acid dehydrogenase YdfG
VGASTGIKRPARSRDAEVIAFALGRPGGVSLNEILIRPTGQAV